MKASFSTYLVLLLSLSVSSSSVFTVSAAFVISPSTTNNQRYSSRIAPRSSFTLYSSLNNDESKKSSTVSNNNRPELPEIKGDYNWDEKFASDPEWITENIPGKTVLSQGELAAQVSALSKLEEKYRKERLGQEYDDARILGWTSQAEMYNGRYAMFFLVVGLLTEYWTGISIPGQIEEMLRVGGFIGPDY